MTDLLAIGASGLRAYRTALAATGDNIANAQTPGYTRRSVKLAEVSITGGPNILYRNRERFDGVDVTGIERASDAFRTGEARLASSAEGNASATATWMQVAERALDDGDNGVGAALGRMYSTADAVAADPLSRQPRSAFLAAVDTVASAVRASAEGLQRTSTGISDAAQSSIDGINASLAALADLNLAIRHAAPGTSTFVELSDQRDRLVDGIAGQLDISITVSADGATVLTSGGKTLVASGTATPLILAIASDGRLSFAVSAAPLVPQGGALAGLTASAATVADRRTGLDALATDIATQINGWHAAGRTPSGAVGIPLLAISAGASTLTALTSDPDQLAAASPAGVVNGNALALAGIRSSGATEAGWAALAGAQAQATSLANTHQTIAAARLETANAARDGVEGVDLDREAADLLRFQQAYEGSARVIQMAKETLDAILRLF